jgi:hypothetical protein
MREIWILLGFLGRGWDILDRDLLPLLTETDGLPLQDKKLHRECCPENLHSELQISNTFLHKLAVRKTHSVCLTH